MKYLGIGATSAAAAFSLTLNNWLLVMGIQARGEDQAVITSIGGTAFGITILIGIIAMITVAVLSLRGTADESGRGVVTLNALLASAVGSGIGAWLGYLLWPMYVDMLVGTGVFPRGPLSEPLHVSTAISSLGGTALVGLIAGAIGARAKRRGARSVAGGPVVAGVQGAAGQVSAGQVEQEEKPSRMIWRIFSIFLGVATVTGAHSIYRVIANAQIDNRDDAYVLYFAMGMMLCLAMAFFGGIFVHTIGAVLTVLMGNGDLVNNTISRVTRAGSLVLPLGLAAAAIGIISMWLTKMVQAFGPGVMDSSSSPGDGIKFFSGPILILVVALISIMLSAGSGRTVSGTTVWPTVLIDAAAYLAISTTIAYSVMIINETITTAVLRSGPIPDIPSTLPDWRAFGVIIAGVLIRMTIVWARSRREMGSGVGTDIPMLKGS